MSVQTLLIVVLVAIAVGVLGLIALGVVLLLAF